MLLLTIFHGKGGWIRMIAELYFIDNAVMDILVIRLAAAISGRRIKPMRSILFALAGAVYATIAVTVLTPMMHWTLKIAGSLLLSAVLPFRNAREYVMGVLSMLAAIFVSGGAVTSIAMLALRGIMGIDSLTPGVAIAGAMVVYLLPSAVRRLRGERAEEGEALELVIVNHGQRHSLKAFADTGNKLREPISGLPVIAVYSPLLKERANIPVPMTTVLGNGSMLGFRPDLLELNGRRIDAVVVRTECGFGEYEALIPPCFIKKQERGEIREDGKAVL